MTRFTCYPRLCSLTLVFRDDLAVTGPQVSAEVKALRQWCENQLKKLSLNEGNDMSAMGYVSGDVGGKFAT